MSPRKFQYRLDSLLTVKQQMLDQHRRKLRSLSFEVQKAQQAVAQLTAAWVEESKALQQDRADVTSTFRTTTAMEARVREAQRRLHTLEEQRQQANTQYLSVSQELDAIQRVRDAQHRRHQRDVSLGEQQELDDVVLRQWNQQRPGRS